MKDSENEHKRVVNDLQTELSQVRQEQQASAERNELLEAQFQRESMASISQLNEKLVAKVMEATETANQAIKRNKKLQQQIRPSTLLRPTAASRASAAAASEANSRRASNSTASARSLGASPSRTLKKKKTSTGAASSTTKKTKRTKGTDTMTLLREANLGKYVNSIYTSDGAQLTDNGLDLLFFLQRGSVLTSETRATQSQASMARNSHPTTPSRADNYSLEKEADTVQLPPEPASPQPLSQQQTIAHDAGIGGEKISSTPEPSARSTRRTKTKPPAIKVPTVSPKTYVSPMQVRQQSFAIHDLPDG
ncbi:unnamed protein product [Phytophthora lilii]|uniref:Unnamed protein product n=1 Tax=Phytophthora lilii TaxID=2077276 RepID=A0A9W6U3N4_9STRA|nr:unnamed protein product [Phytophthora lilii]